MFDRQGTEIVSVDFERSEVTLASGEVVTAAHYVPFWN